jgi:DNA-binding CsgD family transcriptional regulator
VLELLSQGYLYKEIAEQLQISYRTVSTHLEHIYGKLHVHSRAQAVAKHLRQTKSIPVYGAAQTPPPS